MGDIDIAGLEGFELVEAGGFGLVYRARQPRFERTVAVKVLQTRVTDDRIQHQFRRECAAAGRLTGHPHIVTVFDAGFTPEGRPYLVMEWMDGGSLDDHLHRKGPLGPRAIVNVGAKVAGALEAAHAEGVLHRDVKPANILISRYGEPELADFGIASLGPATGLSASMYALTPVHAAPEVLEGLQASPASDVYSLASTLWTLLTGEAPFAGPPDEAVVPMVMRILRSEPPALDRPDVPDELITVLSRSLAKAPGGRPATAAEFASELHSALDAPAAPAPTPQVRHVDDAPAPEPEPKPASQPASPPQPPRPPAQVVPVANRTDVTEVVAPPQGPPAKRRRGIVIGAAAVLACLVAAGAALAIWASGDDSTATTGPPTTGGRWPPEVGDCLADSDPAPDAFDPHPASCDDLHMSEVAGVFLYSTQGKPYPGADALSRGTYASPCTADVYDHYMRTSVSSRPDLFATEIQPDADSWRQGKATFVCVLERPGGVETTGRLGG